MKDDNDRIKILNFKRAIEQKNNDKEIIDKKKLMHLLHLRWLKVNMMKKLMFIH
jgi:hypothetical protein